MVRGWCCTSWKAYIRMNVAAFVFLTAGKFPPTLDITPDGPAHSRKLSKVVEVVRGQWKIVGRFPPVLASNRPSAPTIGRASLPCRSMSLSLFLPSPLSVLSVASSSLSVSLRRAVPLPLGHHLCRSLSLLLARSARS